MAGRLRIGGVVAVLAAAALLAPPALASAARCAGAPGGGLTLTNVAADGERARAVGSDGLVARSRKPRRWTIEPTGVEHALRGVGWTGDAWVAIGDAGTILHRTGTEWPAASGIPSVGLRGIAARPGLAAASGNAGTVVTSTDGGATWQRATSGTDSILWGGTTVGDELWLSGQESTVIRSADGASWSPVATAPAPTDSTAAPRPFLWQLASDGERVVAVGDFGAILAGTAADGLAAVRSPSDEILRGVAHAGGRWVAVGSGGDVLFSDDGVSWRLGSAPTTVDLRGVTWTGERWVAVGDQSTAISSENGRDWQVDVTAMPCALLGLARSGGRFVAVGGGGRILRANRGSDWRRSATAVDEDLYGLAQGGKRFVAVGADGTILTSDDRREWSVRPSPVELNLHSVHWTGEEFLAGGDRGEVIRSRDGLRWRRSEFPGFHSVRGFATGGGSVVAVGAGTIARREASGGPWDLESAGTAKFQTGIAYGAGRFVVIGHNGSVLVSTDGGGSWEPGTSGVEVNLDAITWTGSRFIATGEGIAISSADGLAWEPEPAPARRSVRALIPYRDLVFGVGDGNTRVELPR
ncbi:MAG TPA: hypothetical protein VFY99_08845 [Solirubrobacterales bacterium]